MKEVPMPVVFQIPSGDSHAEFKKRGPKDGNGGLPPLGLNEFNQQEQSRPNLIL